MADDILQRLQAATDPAQKAALVANFALSHEDPALAELVPMLAFLRWFDEAVVAVLLPGDERQRSAALFARLIELPFVEQVSYGYALHDLTRQGLLAEATTEQRLAAAQAATTYGSLGTSESWVECLYCLALGEQSNAAQRLLDDRILALSLFFAP